jgi:preprotein translocase subunit SecY
MKKFIETLQNIWRIKELKEKILFTLGLLLVYRLGSNVVLPGVNPNSLAQLQNQAADGLIGLLNAFTGGAFANASIMALGIMPYISASIVIQLLGMAVPSIQKMQKEGESGRRKLNQITRVLTIVIAMAQAPGYLANLMGQNAMIFPEMESFFYPMAMLCLITGTVFAMWLGEKITDKGIGNGISLLIMVGIIANFPQALFQEFVAKISGGNGGGIAIFVIEIAALYLVFMFAIALTQAVRRVPVQYARRTTGRGFGQEVARSFIPLKVNAAGVMPIIFAQAIMFIPLTVLQYSGASGESFSTFVTFFSNIQGLYYNLTFAIMIILFTYFYTAIQVNTNQMAEDLKRNGGFVPGIKPGKNTAEYIDNILSKITLPGSILLAVLAILPAVAMTMSMGTQWSYFYGGTSLLIIVGVSLDTLQQIESYLLNRHYDGLMKSGRIKGRTATTAF